MSKVQQLIESVQAGMSPADAINESDGRPTALVVFPQPRAGRKIDVGTTELPITATSKVGGPYMRGKLIRNPIEVTDKKLAAFVRDSMASYYLDRASWPVYVDGTATMKKLQAHYESTDSNISEAEMKRRDYFSAADRVVTRIKTIDLEALAGAAGMPDVTEASDFDKHEFVMAKLKS